MAKKPATTSDEAAPVDAGPSEGAGAHNPSQPGSTPGPATTDDGAGLRPDVPADPSVGVNAQGDVIPVAHDAKNAGAAADKTSTLVSDTPDGAQVTGRHNHDGTTTDFNVWGAGEGRHLIEIRVPTPTPDGDVFRHAFSGDADTFTINGLPTSGTATVTNLQGDGRPQDVSDVTQGQGAEIRFDVEPLDPDAVTPTPDPGQGKAPSVAFAAVPPTEEELAAAQDTAAEQRSAGDEADAGVADDESSTLPAGSGAAGLDPSAPDGVPVEPTEDGLPEDAVDSGNPIPDDEGPPA